MTHDNSIIEVLYDSKHLINFNAKSPNVDELVKLIIERELTSAEKFSCQTDIEDFDKEKFEEIIVEFVDALNTSLKLEICAFEKAMNFVERDRLVESFKQ